MANVWILPLILVPLGLIAITGTAIYVIRINWLTRKINIRANSPLIDMEARKQFMKGYTRGIVKSMTPRKNGTMFFEIYPLDVEQGENAPPIELLTLVVDKEALVGINNIDGSSRRNIIKIIYRNKSEMPESMRETLEGNFMEVQGQKAWLKKTFGKMISAGDEAIAESMRFYARGNVGRITLASVREEIAEASKLFNKPAEEENKK